MPDVNGLGEKIVSSVRGYVARSLEAIETRIAALEARPVPDVDGPVKHLQHALSDLNERFKLIPPPQEQPDLSPLTERIASLEGRPPPDLTPLTVKFDLLQARGIESHDHLVDALDTAAAEIYRRVEPLEKSIEELETRPTNEEVLKLAQAALTSTRAGMLETLQVSIVDLFKALPIPQKGDPGDPGRSVTVEDFRAMFEASYARFEVEAERRVTDLVQRAIERIPIPKDGKDGRDGEDGFDLRHFDVAQLDERSFMLRFKDLNREKTGTITLPVPIVREIWRPETSYRKGDIVTWGGSAFVKQTDEPGGKPEEGAAWRLFIKRGRDGKDGQKGEKGDAGKAGRNGRDLTQMGADGSKW